MAISGNLLRGLSLVVVTATAATVSTTATVSITAVTTVTATATALATRTTTAAVSATTLPLEVSTAAAAAGRRNLLETITVSSRSRLSSGRRGSSRRSGGRSRGSRGFLSPALGAGSRSGLGSSLDLSRIARNHLEALGERVLRTRGLGVPPITSSVCRTIVHIGSRDGRGLGSLTIRWGGSGVKLGQAGMGDGGIGTDGGLLNRRSGVGLGDLINPGFLGGEGSILNRGLLNLSICDNC